MAYPSSPFLMDRHRVPARTHVSFRPSVLPSFRRPCTTGNPYFARKGRKKLQNIRWNIEFFSSNICLSYWYYYKNEAKAKIPQESEIRAQKYSRQLCHKLRRVCTSRKSICEDEKHFTFLKRFEPQFLGIKDWLVALTFREQEKDDAIMEILPKYWEKHRFYILHPSYIHILFAEVPQHILKSIYQLANIQQAH